MIIFIAQEHFFFFFGWGVGGYLKEIKVETKVDEIK